MSERMNPLSRPWVIIGTGQLGCSLASALHASGKAPPLLGVETQLPHRERAADLGYFQQVYASVEEAVEDAALIVLAAPLRSTPGILAELAIHAAEDAVVTDVGSVKGWVVQQQRELAPGVCFVPGHPIAGTEKSGPSATDGELFRHRIHWLCPLPEHSASALLQVEHLWRLAGADVQAMPYALHDTLYARTSHTAQLLSWVLAEALDREELYPCPYPALYRTLRIGGSDVGMWQDIFLTNREALLAALKDVARNLERLSREDETGMLQALHWRRSARRIPTPVRPEWLAADQYSDFGNLLSPTLTLAAAYAMTVTQWQDAMESSLIPYLGAGFLGLTRPAAAQSLWWSAISAHAADALHQRLQAWIVLLDQAERDEKQSALQQRLEAARKAHGNNLQRLQLNG